jgi:glycosyltransferase involved in cell wall biosynthesis
MKLLAISTAAVTAINRSIYVELKNHEWQVDLVIPRLYPVTAFKKIAAEVKRKEDPDIHVLELKGKNPRLFHFPEIKSIISKCAPQVVLIESDPVGFMAFHVGKVCSALGIPMFCLSCENLSFDIIATMKRRGLGSIPSSIIKKFLYWRAKPHISGVFTINDDGSQLFKQKGFKCVVKIPLGYDPAVFFPNADAREETRSKLGINIPVIAYFGRIVPEKGVDLLLKALATLKEHAWVCMLDKFTTYENPYHKHIDDLIISLGLKERVVRIEANHFEIAAYMNAADVVVIPSVSTPQWKEQYGRVAPEAMACGKLVISAKSGALPELIGNCGILFEEGNQDELKLILEDYLRAGTKYQQLSLDASIRAREFLSIKTQAEFYGQAFTDVLKVSR